MDAHAREVAHGTSYHYRTPRGIAPMRYISEAKIEKYLLDNLVAKIDESAEFAAKKEKPVDPAAIKRKMDRLTDLLLRDLITQDKYEAEYRSLQAQLRPVPKRVDKMEVMSALEMYGKLSRESKKAFWSRIVQRIDYEDGEIRFFLYL